MIGDGSHDVMDAKTNKFRSVGVIWVYGTRQKLVEAGACHFCESPEDLKQLIQQARKAIEAIIT